MPDVAAAKCYLCSRVKAYFVVVLEVRVLLVGGLECGRSHEVDFVNLRNKPYSVHLVNNKITITNICLMNDNIYLFVR